MRIITSFTLLLVLGNFKTSFEMAIIKGLGSAPETTEDCSSGETTRVPEAANVRSKNPKTDPAITEADLPQLQADDDLQTSITPKEKRCARRETITVDDRVGIPLSLKRRDINLEKEKQRCENCKKSFSCRKSNRCNHCNLFCNKVEAAEASARASDVTVAPDIVVQQTDSNNNEAGTTEAQNAATIVASRFGLPSLDVTRPRYYTLGQIEPGPLMHLFAKAFNMPSEENFEKLVILGKLRGEEVTENLDNLLIVDQARVFGSDKNAFATVHQPLRNIDPAKIADLDRRLNDAITRRKQQLNTDQLSNDQLHNVIDEVLQEITQNPRPEDKEISFTEQPLQLAETETKCSVDEAVDDLLDVISPPARTQEATQKLEDQKEYKPEEQEPIKNPPIIQDGFNTVGQSLDDGYVDDNEEARPNNEETVPKLKPVIQEPPKTPKELDLVQNENPQEILTVDSDVKPAPKSDNQINEPEMEKSRVGEALPSGPSQDLEENIMKTVKDGLKIGSNDLSNPRELDSQSMDLAKNIVDTVKDSLKIVSSGDENVGNPELQKEEIGGDIVEETLPENENEENRNPNIGPFVEEPNQVFVQNDDSGPSPANMENSVKTFPETLPESLNHPTELENKMEIPSSGFKEEQESSSNNQMGDDINPAVPNSVNIQQNEKSSESIESNEETHPEMTKTSNSALSSPSSDPTVAETLPEFEIRSQFSEESSSEELPNFGSLVPRIKETYDAHSQKLYFVGKDIKLPLQMYQDKDGVMQLRVDVDKLCHCKNKNCTRKHVDDGEVTRKLLENEKEQSTNDVLSEMNVRNDETNQRHEDLMNSFVHKDKENSEVFKRSPKINSPFEYNQKNTVEDDEGVLKIEGIYQFEKEEEEKIENDLEKLNENIKKYLEEENSVPVNKANVALFKDVEKTKDVGRMITLAGDLLTWMKDLATTNLNSS